MSSAPSAKGSSVSEHKHSSQSESQSQSRNAAVPAKVLVFGGNGLLGQEMVATLTEKQYSKNFPQVTAVVRAQTLSSKDPKKAAVIARLRSTGAKLLAGDPETASASEIASWLSGYDIVISTIGFFTPGTSIEHKLLQAVELAGVSWYIPAIFGFDVYKMHTEPTPFMAEKKVVIEAVKAVSEKLSASGSNKKLNYFVLNVGLFLEYLISPNGERSFAGIDIGNSTLNAPYSMDVAMSTTSIPDIARLTVEALLLRDQSYVKNQILWTAADTFSYGDLHKLLEQHFQKKFQKKILTREEGRALVQKDVNYKDGATRFAVAWGESVKEGIAWPVEKTFNAKYLPNLKLTTVKDRLQKLYPQHSMK